MVGAVVAALVSIAVAGVDAASAGTLVELPEPYPAMIVAAMSMADPRIRRWFPTACTDDALLNLRTISTDLLGSCRNPVRTIPSTSDAPVTRHALLVLLSGNGKDQPGTLVVDGVVTRRQFGAGAGCSSVPSLRMYRGCEPPDISSRSRWPTASWCAQGSSWSRSVPSAAAGSSRRNVSEKFRERPFASTSRTNTSACGLLLL